MNLNLKNKQDILASSSGWVAVILNFFPGLGTGYIYQRRWRQYFLTLGSVLLWILLGIIFQANESPSQKEQLIGLSGLLLISVVSAVESLLAYKKSIKTI